MTVGGRALWLDVARGVCVIAVVLLHVRIFVYDPHVPEVPETDGWRQFTEFLGPFRLPLLFALSGLLVSERVRHGWRDRRNLLRAASSYWIYLVWLGVLGLMSLAAPGDGLPFEIPSPADFALQLVLPDSPLWFVFALLVYLVVCTSLHRLPGPAVLGGFAALALLAGFVPADLAEAQWLHILASGVYFAAGVHLPRALVWFAGGRVLVKLLASVAVFVPALLLWQLTDEGTVAESAARLLRDAAAITVGITTCALVARARPLARPLAAVGRRTLPVYVLQLPLLWLLYLLPVTPALHAPPLAWLLAPLLATALVVLVSLLIYHLVQPTPLRALFDVPRGLRTRILNS